MDAILKVVIDKPPKFNIHDDDDFSDRLSHRVTVLLLVVFATLVTSKQFFGSGPIQCWAPAHFSGAQEEYANNYCWIRNTYYLPLEEDVPRGDDYSNRMMVTYYQWIPMILLVQALLFYLPKMFWETLSSRAGINIRDIVMAGENLLKTEMSTEREKTLLYMTRQFDRYLASLREEKSRQVTIGVNNCLPSPCFSSCDRRKGNYLVVLYLFFKALALLNVIGQLIVMNLILASGPHLYGVEVIKDIVNNKEWTDNSPFPRSTMCDFKVRRLGSVQRYTVQCVLPINLFNEKIYIFIWFWMIFVAGMLLFSLLLWILRSTFKVDRLRYIRKHIRLMSDVKDARTDDKQKKNLQKFVETYLGRDGVFVLRLIGHNTNAVTITELVCALYQNFKEKTPRTKGPTYDGV